LGRSTTRAVVVSIFLVILVDLVFTTLFFFVSWEVGPQVIAMEQTYSAAIQPETMISLRNLRVSYGDREILHGINFDVMHGETMVILGGSGSGKSTLLRTLVGPGKAEFR